MGASGDFKRFQRDVIHQRSQVPVFSFTNVAPVFKSSMIKIMAGYNRSADYNSKNEFILNK